MTVMAVFVTGILGAVIATTVFKIFHIEDPVAQGLAMGTASHAIGTSKASGAGRDSGSHEQSCHRRNRYSDRDCGTDCGRFLLKFGKNKKSLKKEGFLSSTQ